MSGGGESDDEDADFLSAMADVAPLKSRKRIALDVPSDGPTLAQQRRRLAAENEVLPSEDPNPFTLGDVPQRDPDEVLEYQKDGIQPRVFSKLRRGGYELEAELDLHRKTVKEAREAVYEFLLAASERGYRSVLINHGRGRESATPAKLKSYVAAWLADFAPVLAYSSAPRQMGGAGALLILIKKAKAAKAENRERHGGRA